MTGHGSKDAASIWLAVERVGLPEKKYFKIGEVAALVGVEPHVLRYWQTQFPQVRPQKSRSGHRLYRRKDVETLLLVRELLHVQRFTIAGARQALRGLVRGDRPTTGLPAMADEEPSAAPPVRPYAAPPRAASTEVALLEVEGLEGEELTDALSRQLAETMARGEVAALDLEAEDGASDSDDADDADDADDGLAASVRAHAVAALGAHGRPEAADDGPLASAKLSQGAALSSLTATSRAPSASAAPLPAASLPAPSLPVPSSPAPSSMAPSAAAAVSSRASVTTSVRERTRKEQLGFGFAPSNRDALEAVRAEVVAMLELLDREDAAANRLRARPVAAK